MSLCCGAFITVMQTAELRDLDDLSEARLRPWKWRMANHSEVLQVEAVAVQCPEAIHRGIRTTGDREARSVASSRGCATCPDILTVQAEGLDSDAGAIAVCIMPITQRATGPAPAGAERKDSAAIAIQ